MKKNAVSGFTLIEMVIVIVIIGILMWATMWFGSGRIADLKSQSVKENFIAHYNELYAQHMTSSSHDGKYYQYMTIQLSSGLEYSFDTGLLSFPDASFQLTNFLLDTKAISSARLLFAPYILGCWIRDEDDQEGNMLKFSLSMIPQNEMTYCFEISSETCKLAEVKCN